MAATVGFKVPQFPSPTAQQAGKDPALYRYLGDTAGRLNQLAALVQQVAATAAGGSGKVPTMAEIRAALSSNGAYALPLDGLVGTSSSPQPAIVFAAASGQPQPSLYPVGTIMIQASGGGYDWFVRFAGASAKWTKVNPPSGAHVVTDNTVQTIGPGAAKTVADVLTLSPSSGTAALTITAGQLNSATQFGASVYASGAQSVPNATATVLTFDTELYDRGACHSTSSNTGRIVVPTGGGGIWRFSGFATFASNAVGTRTLVLRGNGTLQLAVAKLPTSTVADIAFTVDGAEVAVVDGDYVEVLATQDSGGALNVNAGLGVTRLTGFKVC